MENKNGFKSEKAFRIWIVISMGFAAIGAITILSAFLYFVTWIAKLL